MTIGLHPATTGRPDSTTTRHDLQAVRSHIRTLLDAGMRLVDIADNAGMNTTGHLNRIMYGPDKKSCNPDIAHRILAVHPQPADTWLVDGIGARRRIRALVRAGWEMRTIAARAGYHPSVASGWANDQRIVRATADRVAALYDELASLDGGSTRARRWAERRGWQPPEAWSDDTIDDPHANPYDWCRDDVDEVAIAKVDRGELTWGTLTKAEKRALFLRHGGQVRATLVNRWGTTRANLTRFAARLADQDSHSGQVAA